MSKQNIGTDISDFEIRRLDQVIGQRQIVNVLKMAIDAHFKTRSELDKGNLALGTTLFAGPSGTGKTMLAKVTHFELGNPYFIETNGVSINSKKELYSILLNLTSHTTFFVDEAQAMDSKTQQILLTAISEKIVYIPMGLNPNSKCSIDLPNFTLLLATTDEHKLIGPLLNRIRIVCHFELYTIDELVEIIRQRAVALKWQYESEKVLEIIAERSKGVPRLALNRYLHICREMAIHNDHASITVDDTIEAFKLYQIDDLGLDKTDRAYLKILLESGRTTLSVLGSKLNKPPQSLYKVTEPFLLREGFIIKDRYSRRVITEKGRRHMEKIIFCQ